MKFSDFTTQAQIEKILGLQVEEAPFTPADATVVIPPTSALVEFLARASLWRLRSELVLRETLISPVLTEVYLPFKDRFTFFSGEELKYMPDPAKPVPGESALWGVCDYVVGARPRMSRPEAPLLSVVEAKREDFETGSWQCAAELYACRLTNLRENKHISVYYGAITIGHSWRFIKLEGQILTREWMTYSLKNLPELLGVWRWILDKQIESLDEAKKSVEP